MKNQLYGKYLRKKRNFKHALFEQQYNLSELAAQTAHFGTAETSMENYDKIFGIPVKFYSMHRGQEYLTMINVYKIAIENESIDRPKYVVPRQHSSVAVKVAIWSILGYILTQEIDSTRKIALGHNIHAS